MRGAGNSDDGAPSIIIGSGHHVEVDGTTAPAGIPWVIRSWDGGTNISVARPANRPGGKTIGKTMSFDEFFTRNPDMLLDQPLEHEGGAYVVTAVDAQSGQVSLTAADGSLTSIATSSLVRANLDRLRSRIDFRFDS